MNVVFDEPSHTYTNEITGEKYLSCTQLLGKYKPKFDAEKMSAFTAKARGTTKEVILKEWADNTKRACDYGTSVHKAIEAWLNDAKVPDDLKHIVDGLKKICPFKRTKVKSEHLLWSHQFKLAGTSDIIEDVGSEYFNVYDFKTNKEFRFLSKYKEYLLEPVSHLQSCEYNSYCLQLSLYAWMYSQLTERKIGRMGLLYYNTEENKWYEYPVPYMKHEVAGILLHYKKNYMVCGI